MKSNSISLDPEMSKELGDCAVGESTNITLKVTCDAMDDTGFRGTVEEVIDYGGDQGEGEPAAPPPPAKGPPAGKSKRAPALAEAIDSEGY